MSVENAEKLLAKLRADKALAVKLQTATRTAFEQIAEEAGLACTSQDVKAVMDKMMKSGELSEEQLGNVAGGATWPLFVGVSHCAGDIVDYLTC